MLFVLLLSCGYGVASLVRAFADMPVLPFQMISPEVSIRFHCVLILLNFFAMACFAAVADFQAKWDIGPCEYRRLC